MVGFVPGVTSEKLDKFQQQIAAGMSRTFDDPATEEEELNLESARLVVFSDLHKGSRDASDDFRRSERAYQAALGYYLEQGHTLFTLGDVEELWKYTPLEVIGAYPQSLELEGEFHRRGRYARFWGNHDDLWRHPDGVSKRLDRFYPGIKVREALKLRVRGEGEELGLIFLVHGHQGTLDSERCVAGAQRLHGPKRRRTRRTAPSWPDRARRRRQRPRRWPRLTDGDTMSMATRTDTQSPALHVADSHDLIRVHGARENDLKDVSVEIPKRRLRVFTGVSGSGKSSLCWARSRRSRSG
jgi:hypothetical protein